MLEMAMQEDGHEPSVDLKVVLNLSAVLPSKDSKGMRVWSKELFITQAIDRARNDEDQNLEKRDDDNELPDANSWAEA